VAPAPHALIIDDDVDFARSLAGLVAAEGFATAIAHTLAEARQQLVLRRPDVVLLDLMLPDGNGIDLFDGQNRPGESEIVLVTGHASLETSIQALRLGAADYLLKPVNARQLKVVLSRIAAQRDLHSRIATMEGETEQSGRFGKLWGRSAPMRDVYRRIARVAPTSVSVLLSGESGTGKELVARMIHALSRRSDRPFHAVNCGAISPQLIESEVFGHEKGSFTGATYLHRGYFERANGGTLLLDEIVEMPAELQVKLLRVLETGTFLRIGGDEPIETDVRIIAATNRNPTDSLAAGTLREDLFYRLNVFGIEVPPLRERGEDIALIAQHFLAEINDRERTSKRLAPEAVVELTRYHWPGNVRQLLNAVQRAFIMAEDDVIGPSALSFDTTNGRTWQGDGDENISVRVGATVAEVERRLILATLERCGGRRDRAAALLGVSPKTLYNRLKSYGTPSARGPEEPRL
jgi:two-component system response regulator AtoC